MGRKGRSFLNQRVFHANTPADMERIGSRVAAGLFPGAFVALRGEMGAGKTVFSRGVGLALHTEEVRSPTFTIVQEHDTCPPLFHFDAYRVSEEELYDIGFDDYLSRNGIILLEWPQNVPGILPPARLEVEITGSGDEVRTVTLRALGEPYETLLQTWDEDEKQ